MFNLVVSEEGLKLFTCENLGSVGANDSGEACVKFLDEGEIAPDLGDGVDIVGLS